MTWLQPFWFPSSCTTIVVWAVEPTGRLYYACSVTTCNNIHKINTTCDVLKISVWDHNWSWTKTGWEDQLWQATIGTLITSLRWYPCSHLQAKCVNGWQKNTERMDDRPLQMAPGCASCDLGLMDNSNIRQFWTHLIKSTKVNWLFNTLMKFLPVSICVAECHMFTVL